MSTRQETLLLANSLPLWIFCILVVGLVFAQTAIFLWLSKRYAASAGVSKTDVRRSVKAGLISTLGPALSIFVVGLGLITQIGAPLTLSRLSVIGNATYEASSADKKAKAGLILGLSASLASFGFFAVDYARRDLPNLTAVLVGFLGMIALDYLAKHKKAAWLKEWALAFAILLALAAVMIFFGGELR